MASEDFSRQTVELIAKRAGNHCSNPDCFALTSGPAADETRSINVGEAAHIYGARSGAARYNAAMGASERSDITNSIWLCRNCHKIADADPAAYTAELLFEWRRAHEKLILEKLGKAGSLMQQKVLDRKLASFEQASYLAQQIILDKPRFWEYKLTAELLRILLQPVERRWKALELDLYALPLSVVSGDEFTTWSQVQMHAWTQQATALSRLAEQLVLAWGPPGQPGSEEEIYRVCGLVGEACHRMLTLEETIRFVWVPSEYDELQSLLIGTVGRNLSRMLELPKRLVEMFSDETVEGYRELKISFDYPPNWVEEFKRASERVRVRLQSRQ